MILAGLLGLAGLTIVVDPFFQYHAPLNGVNYVIDNQQSQNPGIARNFEYDSVILGSSMTDNFDTLLFAQLLGLNTVKLSSNAAAPKDLSMLLEQVNRSDNEVKQVFLCIDTYSFEYALGEQIYELPEYLYDENLFNDVSYLFNKDVLLDYILLPTFTGENTPINEAYWFWQNMSYGEEAVMSSYDIPETVSESVGRDFFADYISANLQTYLLPYIESMPDTVFTVFFPAYSVLHWNTEYAAGTWEAELDGTLQILETLLEYSNVEIYYFQDMTDFITDLNHYSDASHYSKEMNDYMTACFASGEHRLYTVEECREAVEGMREFVSEMDVLVGS